MILPVLGGKPYPLIDNPAMHGKGQVSGMRVFTMMARSQLCWQEKARKALELKKEKADSESKGRCLRALQEYPSG